MKPVIVVTSINRPNAVLRAIADGAIQKGFEFIVIGDTKSPAEFNLEGCRYLDLGAQLATDYKLAAVCPVWAKLALWEPRYCCGGSEIPGRKSPHNWHSSELW
jgi:hypothetical protein